MSSVETATTVAQLREKVAQWRREGARVALTPTMGALHDGHLSLVRLAQQHADRVIVSIFVNPKQFGPNEDFSRYPRTLPEDLALLETVGADLAWTPDVAAMYPDGFATSIGVGGPALAGLDDAHRPGHFDGVATVVAKLLLQTGADVAVFGEKDYQQLQVINQLARDLNIPVEIIGAPTRREADGLALSSRNRYLSPEDRAVAPAIARVLSVCAERLRTGATAAPVMADGVKTLESEGFKVDYLVARHAVTLAEVNSIADGPLRLLVAARLGATRLIDNIGV
ncbi:pantothenate synthetase 2 [Camelimonas fluminis]|uniref:Pantothenate synthetase n=1 Tax=Camelimonas fluminis TaxID=1576911 RepID=A0ABV7UIW0_9HYPH|nr:pantoate--beta-alanine ligase [Camelimonas fluminis]GHE58968.1 pantothenate synthetase 2 [Camelimonas fluminis]